MVDNNSILAHYDADLEGGGDHLIGESRNPGLKKHRPLGRFWMPAFAGMTAIFTLEALK
jgi:hypothetical protein